MYSTEYGNTKTPETQIFLTSVYVKHAVTRET